MLSVELDIHRYGLCATGQEDYHSPRREYIFNKPGGDKLTNFFNFPINHERKNCIWLTTACIEDFLIFNAFAEGFKCVFVIIEDGVRILSATSQEPAIEIAVKSELETYINPKLFLPTH